ncbi:MAG: hypothetical protein JWO52_5934 [Gammaproteobacteria bacterium]|nr:hypothetical protein [Gammaproteobacteria bacterium]
MAAFGHREIRLTDWLGQTGRKPGTGRWKYSRRLHKSGHRRIAESSLLKTINIALNRTLGYSACPSLCSRAARYVLLTRV